MKGLNDLLNEFYRAPENKKLTKITPLVHSQVVADKPGYPFLKGKAAQNRHLAEFALQFANKHMHGAPAQGGRPARAPFKFAPRHRLHGREQEHLDLMLRMFRGMASYTRSLLAQEFDATACKNSMLEFLDALGGLHSLWREGLPLDSALRKTAPFHVRPKAHMLQHVVLDHVPCYGSPAKFWCYRDEDFVGRVKSICARTKMPSTLEVRVMQKLRVLESLGFRV